MKPFALGFYSLLVAIVGIGLISCGVEKKEPSKTPAELREEAEVRRIETGRTNYCPNHDSFYTKEEFDAKHSETNHMDGYYWDRGLGMPRHFNEK